MPRSRLNRHLQIRGFTIKDVPGDNNCQFHAVADQLEQVGITGWTALKLRAKTVAWLKANGERAMDDGKVGERTLLRDSVGVENWDKYIREMSQHGVTWGDEATLLAAQRVESGAGPRRGQRTVRPPVLSEGSGPASAPLRSTMAAQKPQKPH